MFKNKKPVPIAFVLLSGLYFIYVISSGNSKMIGDEVGGDPGGTVLPLFFSIFMFFTSIYLAITDKTDKKDTDKMSKPEKQLFVLTLIFAIGYILFTRILGFIPCTVLLLFCLSFANQQGKVDIKDWKAAVFGSILSVGNVLVLYTIGRMITRSLLSASRNGLIPLWLGSATFTAGLGLLVITMWIIAFVLICKKRWPAHTNNRTAYNTWLAVAIAASTTQIIYIVFKQLFLVELVKGLIFW
ncbi:tripartite tricarboxylate transporter TctB family protein [Treponema sp. OMZ 840]|uniref:tripartite tricarboxylate transporter TctB family protein n=1 Tax=Treponema sp. OMZ 840 TaxID=244313 RepID=UPI003D94C982